MKTILEKIGFIAFALIALVSTVHAYSSSGMVIDTDNFYFEVYKSNNYGYQLTATPYTYSYNDWLYFDNSFRVYYYDTYYYYDSGWYNFSPSYWNYDPYAYSYYSPNYYYYNNAWAYYPGWTAVYGPAYYGSYYYPSFSNYYSYPLNYYAYPTTYYSYPSQVVAPTYNVGASYNYPQYAYCSQLSISANSVTMNAGESRSVDVRVSNNSPMNFTINSVDVYIDSFDVRKGSVNFDSTVYSGLAGIVKVGLNADDDATTDSFSVDVRINGQFADGTRCSGSTVSDSFNVFVKGSNVPSTATNFATSSTPNTSTSTIAPRGWVEVTPVTSGTSNSSTGSTATSTNTTATTAATAAPAFIEGSCSGIDVVEKNFSVDAGETLNADVYIKNFASEDFVIDYATVKESDDFFAATANKESGKIYSGDYGRIKLSIAANDVSKEATGSMVLSVRGHLENSGKTCTAAAEMLVHVKGKTAVFSGGFSLDVPERVELNGTSGTFRMQAVNTTNETAKVWFETENGVISPSFIVVPANSTIEKIISVNAFAADSGRIFYRTELPGLEVLDKYTNVARKDISVMPSNEDTIENDDEPAAENQDNESADGSSGIVGTAFAVLGGNAGAIVFLLVLLVIVYLVIKILQGTSRRQRKPWDSKEPWMIIR